MENVATLLQQIEILANVALLEIIKKFTHSQLNIFQDSLTFL